MTAREWLQLKLVRICYTRWGRRYALPIWGLGANGYVDPQVSIRGA